jgi:cell division protease FtsH
MSEDTANNIDKEVREIVERIYNKTREILQANMERLHKMAEALMKYETIDKEQIDDIMHDRPVREPAGWSNTPPSAPAVPEEPSSTPKPAVGGAAA